MLRTLRWLTFAALLLLPTGAGAQAVAARGEYVRAGSGWTRLEGGRAFRVEARTITARFVGALQGGPVDASGDDLPRLLDELGRDDPRLAGLAVARSNRLGIHDLLIPVGADPLDVVAALRASPRVDFAEENVYGSYTGLPNDPSFGLQWNLRNVGQTGGVVDADVDAPEAWATQDGDKSVVVAIIDSGTDWSHPDLASNIWSNPGEVLDGIDNDGNGYIDDIRGWDFDDDDNNPVGPFFHGTAVAGVVGAVGNNGLGIVGLAGGAVDGEGCALMPLNVGNFFPIGSVVDDAILYAADNGARVITLSLTIGGSAAIDAAIAYAHDVRGVFIDCAAGNNDASVGYPASLPEVVAVASTNHADARSAFSNVGPELDLAAPGEDILMTDLFGGYLVQSGTSFAAPHVAAAAALLFCSDARLSNADVRQILRSTADDVGAPGFDLETGDGRLNANAALDALSTFVPGAAEPYGKGLLGFHALVPEILVPAPPIQGQSDFGLFLRAARPDALAFLLASVFPASFPFQGGTMLVDIFVPDSLLLITVTDAAGRGLMPLPIPGADILVGLDFYTQWVVADPDAIYGYAMSAGLALTIGSE